MKRGLPAAARTRGEPLLVLGAIVGGWLALRVLLWQSPFDIPGSAVIFARPPAAKSTLARPEAAPVPQADNTEPRESTSTGSAGPNDAPISAPLPAPRLTSDNISILTSFVAQTQPASRIVGQQLLLAAGFSHMELAPQIASYFAAARAAEPGGLAVAAGHVLPARRGPSSARWSGDTWLLVRNGSSGPITAGEPAYGRSQAGAVLRFRLAPSSAHRPFAYVRATRALAGPQEREAAAGLAARPLRGVPLSLAGEVRVSEGSAGREVRPAAFVVTELPAATLPLGLRAEAYVQAGYVGGRFATAFADGQARIDAPIAHLDKGTEIRAGGGVWGGAQKRAARLDIGPSATAKFRLGEAAWRLALDYRWRVAGDALPKSGPALTFSAGF